MQRLRSELVERSFAHVCETGGARRSWLCGIEKVQKRYLIAAVARNLGLPMRKVFGIGTLRGLQAEGGLVSLAWFARFHIHSMLRVGITLSCLRLAPSAVGQCHLIAVRPTKTGLFQRAAKAMLRQCLKILAPPGLSGQNAPPRRAAFDPAARPRLRPSSGCCTRPARHAGRRRSSVW